VCWQILLCAPGPLSAVLHQHTDDQHGHDHPQVCLFDLQHLLLWVRAFHAESVSGRELMSIV
jgi:MOSC domain-containing protein YiiM